MAVLSLRVATSRPSAIATPHDVANLQCVVARRANTRLDSCCLLITKVDSRRNSESAKIKRFLFGWKTAKARSAGRRPCAVAGVEVENAAIQGP